MSSFQGIDYANVSFTRRNYQVYSESITGKIQVRNIGAARWEWQVEFPPLTHDEFHPLWVYVQNREGMKKTFSMVLPDPTKTSPGADKFAFKTYNVRLADMEQEFEYGTDGLILFTMSVIEVL